MTRGTGLSLSRQSHGYKRTGTNVSSPPNVLAPESALGSHPRVATLRHRTRDRIPPEHPIAFHRNDRSISPECGHPLLGTHFRWLHFSMRLLSPIATQSKILYECDVALLSWSCLCPRLSRSAIGKS